MKAFVEGMGGVNVNAATAPFSGATNDPNFARRIMKVMTDMGVRQDLLNMVVADQDEITVSSEEWMDFSQQLTSHARPSA